MCNEDHCANRRYGNDDHGHQSNNVKYYVMLKVLRRFMVTNEKYSNMAIVTIENQRKIAFKDELWEWFVEHAEKN